MTKNARLPRISPQGARLPTFLGIDEDEIRITCDGSGKPLCDGCYISLSHSGDYAVCAVSSFPIGVDIEKKRDVNPKLINKICVNDAEREYATDTQNLLLTLWSVKEACFKALSPKGKYSKRYIARK